MACVIYTLVKFVLLPLSLTFVAYFYCHRMCLNWVTWLSVKAWRDPQTLGSGPDYHILFLLQRCQFHLAISSSDFHLRNPVSADDDCYNTLPQTHQASSSAYHIHMCLCPTNAHVCKLLYNSNKCNFQNFPMSLVTSQRDVFFISL